ncbi:MAG: hypothetical protein KatS3mg027_2710 [Bacteroidia bacterium]|nr:MAG: hypothetical protein KatS3mg027_2679 [Bacteroidia bacterium]GIV28871.1 MAG: hypothetical protein KatS3mg027_2685 [Bacteroidia bacterium]GIV28896.1 MAG: hypothetical protein KatS3mg027_2710 [Bacteroidia bacterium]
MRNIVKLMIYLSLFLLFSNSSFSNDTLIIIEIKGGQLGMDIIQLSSNGTIRYTCMNRRNEEGYEEYIMEKEVVPSHVFYRTLSQIENTNKIAEINITYKENIDEYIDRFNKLYSTGIKIYIYRISVNNKESMKIKEKSLYVFLCDNVQIKEIILYILKFIDNDFCKSKLLSIMCE